jgi:hypothetical protein
MQQPLNGMAPTTAQVDNCGAGADCACLLLEWQRRCVLSTMWVQCHGHSRAAYLFAAWVHGWCMQARFCMCFV